MSIFRPIKRSEAETATGSRGIVSIAATHADVAHVRDEGRLVLRIHNPGPVNIGIDVGFTTAETSIGAYLGVQAGSVELIAFPKGALFMAHLSAGTSQAFSYAFGVLEG